MSDHPEDDDRTVYQPKGVQPPASPPPPPPPAPAPTAAAGGKRRRAAAAPTAPSASPSGQQIANGEVLNGIYRITRFIAKGGMGEVYEAVNVHQPDEKVAVKVMLQHLAQDELVAAMFAKEAATLTRLHHEAIVQYRLAARDTQGRPYIVTEFIDGSSLEARLGELKLSDAEFLAIAQKLAAGLGTAHTLGAIHRDIAPDNILLAGGDPARAKIIDFGIAKDAREQSATIVGDGFAGKLRYVAPEQLGEYGRNVGPWSDIYSLALTLRAVLAGRQSDMGGSLSDAVRKRMTVPDLSDIPEPFRPAFEAALQPDPARRPQTMAQFNFMLSQGGTATGFSGFTEFPGGTGGSAGAGEVTQLTVKPASGPTMSQRLKALLPSTTLPAGLSQNRLPLMIGGGVLGLLALVGIVIAVSIGGSEDVPPPPVAIEGDGDGIPAAPVKAAPGTPEFAALTAQAVADIPCSWLNLADASPSAARFTGAAAVPAEAQARLADALEAAGASVPALDFSDVVRLPSTNCGIIDALRSARSPTLKITTPQRTYEARREVIDLGNGVRFDEASYAKALIQVSGKSANQQIAMVIFSAVGGWSVVTENSQDTAEFVGLLKGDFTDDGLSFTNPIEVTNPQPTGTGYILITSPAPLPENMFSFDAGWPERFREGARSQGWAADAMWFTVEDRQPG